MANDGEFERVRSHKDLVTVIVPVYNIAEYLGFCLQSILDQTYHDFELIVVDDGSTDGSLAICRDFASKDDRIRLIEQSNEGVARARNAALDRARGDFVCFIDSDDWVEPTYLELLHDAIGHEGADIAICGYYVVGNDRFASKEIRFEEGASDEHGLWKGAMSSSTFNMYLWNKMYRMSTVEGIRFVHQEFWEDYSYNLEAFARTDKARYVQEILYHYRRRELSASTSLAISTDIDIIKIDLAICKHLEQRGFYDCLPVTVHRALNHLARHHPAKGDVAAEKAYREGREAIEAFYKKERQRGSVAPVFRLKHLAFELLGDDGYQRLSSLFQRAKTIWSKDAREKR